MIVSVVEDKTIIIQKLEPFPSTFPHFLSLCIFQEVQSPHLKKFWGE